MTQETINRLITRQYEGTYILEAMDNMKFRQERYKNIYNRHSKAGCNSKIIETYRKNFRDAGKGINRLYELYLKTMEESCLRVK